MKRQLSAIVAVATILTTITVVSANPWCEICGGSDWRFRHQGCDECIPSPFEQSYTLDLDEKICDNLYEVLSTADDNDLIEVFISAHTPVLNGVYIANFIDERRDEYEKWLATQNVFVAENPCIGECVCRDYDHDEICWQIQTETVDRLGAERRFVLWVGGEEWKSDFLSNHFNPERDFLDCLMGLRTIRVKATPAEIRYYATLDLVGSVWWMDESAIHCTNSYFDGVGTIAAVSANPWAVEQLEIVKEELQHFVDFINNHPTLSNFLSPATVVEELGNGDVVTTIETTFESSTEINGDEITVSYVWAVITLTEFASGEVNAIAVTEEFSLIGNVVVSTFTTTIYDDKIIAVSERDGNWTTEVSFADGTSVIFRKGRVLAATSDKITIQDALEILRYTVGLPSVLNECELAFQAALIVSEETPTIQDALQILRHIVGNTPQSGVKRVEALDPAICSLVISNNNLYKTIWRNLL
jgi:hypothetical protein